jgi:hypothetical protein
VLGTKEGRTSKHEAQCEGCALSWHTVRLPGRPVAMHIITLTLISRAFGFGFCFWAGWFRFVDLYPSHLKEVDTKHP